MLFYLLVEPIPLKNISESQLGWWNSQYMKNKTCSTPPTNYGLMTWTITIPSYLNQRGFVFCGIKKHHPLQTISHTFQQSWVCFILLRLSDMSCSNSRNHDTTTSGTTHALCESGHGSLVMSCCRVFTISNSGILLWGNIADAVGKPVVLPLPDCRLSKTPFCLPHFPFFFKETVFNS